MPGEEAPLLIEWRPKNQAFRLITSHVREENLAKNCSEGMHCVVDMSISYDVTEGHFALPGFPFKLRSPHHL